MNARTKRLLAGLAAAAAAAGGLFYWIQIVNDPWRLPRSDWRQYKRNFVSSEGRVIDTGNGNVTHSEGQGYGMLLAEAYGDRATFDLIWNWTRSNLQTRPSDKLISWLWKPSAEGGAVADPNNASDAEILIAWALIRASERWGSYTYQQAAAEILVELRRLAVRDSPLGPVLLPGVDGFTVENGYVLNPSYLIFPAFQSFTKAFPGSGWDQISKTGTAMVSAARFGQWSLTPDWVLQSGEEFSLKAPFPPDFGYNAVRVPLHIAWSDSKSPLLVPFSDFWKSLPTLESMPATVNLETGAFGKDPALPGMQAIARFILACRQGTGLIVRDIPPVMPEEPYYSASLKLLTKVAVRESLGGKR